MTDSNPQKKRRNSQPRGRPPKRPKVATGTGLFEEDEYDDQLPKSKEAFERHRQAVLALVPESSRKMFGEIGVAKFGKGHNPALILHPFDLVPPHIRSKWIDSVRKLKRLESLDRTPYIVYWYDSLNPTDYYGYIPQNSFIPYSEAKEKGYFKPMEVSVQRKLDGKALSKIDQDRIKAYYEIEEDLLKQPEDRIRGTSDFREAHEDDDDDDDDDDALDDTEEVGKSKGSEIDDKEREADNNETSVHANSAKKKKKKKKVMAENQNEDETDDLNDNGDSIIAPANISAKKKGKKSKKSKHSETRSEALEMPGGSKLFIKYNDEEAEDEPTTLEASSLVENSSDQVVTKADFDNSLGVDGETLEKEDKDSEESASLSAKKSKGTKNKLKKESDTKKKRKKLASQEEKGKKLSTALGSNVDADSDNEINNDNTTPSQVDLDAFDSDKKKRKRGRPKKIRRSTTQDDSDIPFKTEDIKAEEQATEQIKSNDISVIKEEDALESKSTGASDTEALSQAATKKKVKSQAEFSPVDDENVKKEVPSDTEHNEKDEKDKPSDDDESDTEMEWSGDKKEQKLAKKKKLSKSGKVQKAEKGTQNSIEKLKKRTIKAERALFRQCETKYGDLVLDWNRALQEKNAESLLNCFNKIFEVMSQFSVPFMEMYLSPFHTRTMAYINSSDNTDLHTKYKELRRQLKEVHKAKSSTVPDGFQSPTKKLQFEKAPETKSASGDVSEEPVQAAEKSDKNKVEKPATQIPKKTLTSSDGQKGLPLPKKSAEIVKAENQKLDAKAALVPQRKGFQLGVLMKRETKPLGEPAQSTVKESHLPKWLVEKPTDKFSADGVRLLGLEFLKAMASKFPDECGIEKESLALALERAIWTWSQQRVNSQVHKEDTEKQVDKLETTYWDRVHAIVAAICGKSESGTLMHLIKNGEYSSASKVVELPDEDLVKSFEGHPFL